MSLFQTYALTSAWQARKAETRVQRLQAYSDILYQLLADDFRSRRAELQSDMQDAIRTATSLRELSIPLWTYNSAYYRDRWADIYRTANFEQTQSELRAKGHDWYVGLVDDLFDPMTTDTDDTYEGWTYSWTKAPVTVAEIVKKTDLCKRLSLLFGDRLIITPVVIRETYEACPLNVLVRTISLTLHFYPNGLPLYLSSPLAEVRSKYANYVPAVYEPNSPYVWRGIPVPRTPPPSSPPSSPPPIRRSVILNPEDEDDVAAELFCYCGARHTYFTEPEDE